MKLFALVAFALGLAAALPNPAAAPNAEPELEKRGDLSYGDGTRPHVLSKNPNGRDDWTNHSRCSLL